MVRHFVSDLLFPSSSSSNHPHRADAYYNHNPFAPSTTDNAAQLLLALAIQGLLAVLAQTLFLRLFFGTPVRRAEAQKATKQCLKSFLHRCFLVVCIVDTRKLASQPREAYLYLFSAAVLFQLQRILCIVAQRLDHLVVLGGLETDGRPGSSKQRGRQRSGFAMALAIGLFLTLNVVVLYRFMYQQLLLRPSAMATARGPAVLRMGFYPLFGYDAVIFLCKAALVALKFLLLVQEQDVDEVPEQNDAWLLLSRMACWRGSNSPSRGGRTEPRVEDWTTRIVWRTKRARQSPSRRRCCIGGWVGGWGKRLKRGVQFYGWWVGRRRWRWRRWRRTDEWGGWVVLT